MKTNTMMRSASVMLMAVLLTTSSISTTFAKYTTQGSAEDSARVARWGVTATVSGSLFDKTYLSGVNSGLPGNGKTDGEDETVLSVESTNNVVAPGTMNQSGLTLKVEGTPEVDVLVTLCASTTNGDIYLDGVGLPDLTTASKPYDTFDAEDYMPIKFTLSRNGKVNESDKDITLSQLINRLNGLSGRFDAGVNLASTDGFGTYVISWKWDYSQNDKADTLLGSLSNGSSLIQGVTLKEGEQYNLQTDLKLELIVTQVD